MNYCFKTFCLMYFIVHSSLCNATQFGQVTVTDPAMGSRAIVYEEINGYAVAEGDILLGKVTDLNNKGAVITPKLGGSRWPNGMVPYEIDEDLPFVSKLAIMQAIDHLQQRSHIEFILLTTKNRYDYRDYISFVRAEGTICSSYVGRQGGKQIVSLALRCSAMNTVHELGHALGMWHEQSRSDRDNFIHIMWENIEDRYKYNFNQQLTNGRDFGDYDYQSIMHYGPYTFSKNGQKTIIPLIEGVEIGQREQLSEKDIAAINAMYPEA